MEIFNSVDEAFVYITTSSNPLTTLSKIVMANIEADETAFVQELCARFVKT